MPNQTQYFRLFNLLKGAPSGMSKEDLGKHMGVAPVSVPVYIFELKKQFKCDIESIRTGKQVVAYKIVNFEKTKVPEFRRGTSQPVVKMAVPVKISSFSGDEDPEHDITRVGVSEMADIRSSLGVGIGSFSRYSE